jgi:FixJ family two-component response regulator
LTSDATIYVIDDDDSVRDAIRVLLECEGFHVIAFASCTDFLRLARPDRASCLVLDVHLPGMGGLELLDRIQRDKLTLPTVLMTARPDPATLGAADRAGVALLQKPFAADELIGLINEAMRGRLH